LDHYHEPQAALTLPYEARRTRRLEGVLDDGRGAWVRLSGDGILRGGELLTGPAGVVVIVQAAPERVSTAFQRDPRRLARATFHLGRAGAVLQIGDSWLRYRGDLELDRLCEALELRVFHELAPFEPEEGDPHRPAPPISNVFWSTRPVGPVSQPTGITSTRAENNQRIRLTLDGETQ
jgi:urease accessory protein